jgi:hypothetical protein
LLVNCPLCPPLLPCSFPPKFPILLGFPEPNVLLIRAHHNSLFSTQHSYLLERNCIPAYKSYCNLKELIFITLFGELVFEFKIVDDSK